MKDSILKGTGNSRFLKSAIPEGTTWAEALAMLRAGTFPMDLNGINNAGFQQVGTPLNKANLLKDVNALTLGLTGDAVPNDMFSVLAHAGDLHVWKKTVSELETVYVLNIDTDVTNTGGAPSSIIYYADSITQTGTSVNLVSPTSGTLNNNYVNMVGKFFKIPSASDDVYKCVSTTYGSSWISVSAYRVTALSVQKIKNSVVSYPVSVDSNAYQEMTDAIPSSYTLDDVITGVFNVTDSTSSGSVTWKISDEVVVNELGIASLGLNATSITLSWNSSSVLSQSQNLVGKFAMVTSGKSSFDVGKIYYFPKDTVITKYGSGSSYAYCRADRYQTITTSAAVPAKNVITPLGVLGDKVRAQILTYAGTGTYGADNANELTFEFAPKAVIISKITTDSAPWALFLPPILSETYIRRAYNVVGATATQNNCLAKFNKKTLSWFCTSGADPQLNTQSSEYTAIALG